FAGFIFGALASFAQIGAIFSLDPLQPDMGKLNPLTGFKKIFSIKSGYDALRLTFKLATVGSVAYWFVKKEVMGVPLYIANEPASLLPIYAHVGKAIFLSMIVVLFIFAGIDFGLQRWDYSKKMKMTKQEAKQEHKEREGDPQIKARIRSVQREIARRRMMSAVKKADVVITNPTHIAVAITYDKDNMLAPKVVAKGADFIAQKIKAIATEAGVPMVENVPLARTLFKSVKINQYVPRVLYQAVAEVLAYVYRLKNRKF
ncbi:MAG: EscU/YscU/HrcU family type III secretion system export apparatus switch protein, partial [Bdellovibrionota bacterium]